MRQEHGLQNTADFLEETASRLVRARQREQPPSFERLDLATQ
jgi:hypothetical protein